MTEPTNDTANPSLMAHVSIGSNDFDKAVEFYDKVLGVFGAHRIVDFPGAVSWGKQYPEFWVQKPIDGGEAQTANGMHFAFLAASTDEVDKFHAVGLASMMANPALAPNTRKPTTVPFFVIWKGIK